MPCFGLSFCGHILLQKGGSLNADSYEYHRPDEK